MCCGNGQHSMVVIFNIIFNKWYQPRMEIVIEDSENVAKFHPGFK